MPPARRRADEVDTDVALVGRLLPARSLDVATWARGRGWALSVGPIALSYYHSTHSVLVGISRRAIVDVLADHRRGA